jgi:phenylalanyl-tRNA synthetase beta chain
LARRATDALAAQGLDEAVGWSFTGPDLADRLRLPEDHDLRAAIEPQNPMSIEQSRMRTTLLGSLLDVARRNRAYGASALALFEAGAVFRPQPESAGPLPGEPHHVAVLSGGPIRRSTWRDADPPLADFFSAKGILAGLLGALRASWSVEPTESYPFLHPGRAAAIVIDGAPVGWLGEVHPLVAAEWELEGTVAGFELDLDAVPDPPTPVYQDVTSFPEVREDVAVVVGEQVSAAQVIDTVRRAGAPLLSSVEVFDRYRNPELLGEGNVSLALRLSYRAPDRTLTDEEVAKRREAITAALADELGGRVRAS